MPEKYISVKKPVFLAPSPSLMWKEKYLSRLTNFSNFCISMLKSVTNILEASHYLEEVFLGFEGVLVLRR